MTAFGSDEHTSGYPHPHCIIGFTAAGEVLNCNTYDVGLAAAVGLEADKIFILHNEEVSKLGLPAWLPLGDAQNMLLKRIEVRTWCPSTGTRCAKW